MARLTEVGYRHDASTSEAEFPSILFLIRSLGRGGAETQLSVLATALAKKGWRVSIAYFYAGGALESVLAGTDVTLLHVGKSGRWDLIGFAYRLRRRIRDTQPDVLHSYLTASNLVLALLRMLGVRVPIIWGIRSSRMDLEKFDWLSRLIGRAESWLSFSPDLIIANSRAGKLDCTARGFPEEKTVVVPNGVDTNKFRRDVEAGRSFRRECQVPDSAILVGLVSRVDPMKDHRTFLQTAAILSASAEDWRFVCVGACDTQLGESMKMFSSSLGFGERLVWTGERSDLVGVYSGLDILVSTSLGEGFSNVIAEAMACECPCVVTDVGDSAFIVGECGEVVDSGDPSATAAAIQRLRQRLVSTGDTIRHQCRSRIIENFDVGVLVDNSEREILSVIGK